jgi:hypothetical protein
MSRRRFCPRHPRYPIADASGPMDCLACGREAEDARERAQGEAWAAEGARLGDVVFIPTVDGSPSPVLHARPLRRRR